MKFNYRRNRKSLTGFILVFLCVSASLRLLFPVSAAAQVRPVNDYGALGLGRLLKKLNTTASVMMIGAHPDDEDSSLLAYLARGENARAAYLSLTRGDGGQNIIGPELFESLGVIRTEELLQARRLDGAEQYFARAFDYGFSKTLAEAKQKWDEKVILCDVVRAIRGFQPMVVLSRFSGTPSDGHGQHQYAGYITPLAVKAAADPQQCKESGTPWQVLKFYVGQGFGDNTKPPTLRLNTGEYDPMLGRSYFEIAMEGRSQHKSQGEGRIEFHGEQFSGLNLVESHVPKVEKEANIFDGIDTSLSSIPEHAGFSGEFDAEADLITAQKAAQEALRTLRSDQPTAVLPLLINGNRALSSAMQKCLQPLPPPLPPLEQTAAEKQKEEEYSSVFFALVHASVLFEDAIRHAAGLTIDLLSDVETIAPGERFFVTANIFYPEGTKINVKELILRVPPGWKSTRTAAPALASPSFRRETAREVAQFEVTVAKEAKPTQPYWLENARLDDMYSLTDNPYLVNQPFELDPVYVFGKVEIDGAVVGFYQPVRYRYADTARGEIRRELNVVPALSVSVDQKLLIVPESKKPQKRTLTMSITNNSVKAVSGTASLNINAANDWPFTANSKTFSLKSKGEKTSVAFDVTIPAKTKPGTYNIAPNAMVGEGLSTQTMTTIAYPHIQTHRFYSRAETMVNVLDLKVARVKVGYIMGSGDDVPEAIRQMGLNVTMLEEKDVASGDLSKYDTIVVGIRAAETRPDFVANNQRLLDYVKAGGNLIMQYQRSPFGRLNLTPFPASMDDTQRTAAGSIARVVDENAKVTILQPNHPAFNFPNKITDEDFKGWVQERNAYNFSTFDEKYVPLLESHDAGENENKGGLVTAGLGKGNWTYCSYSFFRQLPAGVGGAYRLFANMLSLPKAKSK